MKNSEIINSVYDSFVTAMCNFAASFKEYHDSIGYTKNGEYTFIPMKNIYTLLKILENIEAKSFCDLGCGIGAILMILERITKLKCYGFENKSELIQIYKKMNFYIKDNVKKKDILKLKKQDIEHFDVLYFYEPFSSHKLGKEFALNLAKIISPHQTIIYISAGYIGSHLYLTGKFDMRRKEEFSIYTVKK